MALTPVVVVAVAFNVSRQPPLSPEAQLPDPQDKSRSHWCVHQGVLKGMDLNRTFLRDGNFQSEVGEVFGEIGGALPAKFGGRFSSFFCWGSRQKHFPPKLRRTFHHQTSLRGPGLWRALHF